MKVSLLIKELITEMATYGDVEVEVSRADFSDGRYDGNYREPDFGIIIEGNKIVIS